MNYIHNHVEEIPEWLKSIEPLALTRQIQKLSEQIFELREILGQTSPKEDGSALPANGNCFDLVVETQNVQRRWILQALKESRGNVGLASRILGISRPCLYDKIQSLGIVIARQRTLKKASNHLNPGRNILESD